MGFAGSSRLDDRRRRRIATDPESRSGKIRRIDPPHTDQLPVAVTVEAGSPILTLLPRAQWPLAVLTALAGSLVALLVWAAFRFDSHPLWGRVVGVSHGQAITVCTTLALFASSQICFIIYWFRKRSRRDFAGRYRRWLTASVACLFAAISTGTGLHHTLGHLASAAFPPYAWNTPEVCWTVPVGILVAFLGPALASEVRSVGVSIGLFPVSALAIAACLALYIVGDIAVAAETRQVAANVLSLVASWSLLVGFWWQARHVCRVSNEPPPKGQIRAELKRLIPKRKPRPAADEAASEATPGSESAKPTRRRRKKTPDQDADAATETSAAAQDASRSLVSRASGLITAIAVAPFGSLRTKLQNWKATSAAAAETRKLAREERLKEKARLNEERLAAKAAAVTAKAEAKQRAIAERAKAKQKAADEKAESKRIANEARDAKAAERQKSKQMAEASSQNKSASAKLQPSIKEAISKQVNSAEDDNGASGMSAAERRAARKARKQKRRNKGNESEDLMPAELREDFEDGPRSQKRRR